MTGPLAWMEPIESFFRGKSVSTFRVFKHFLVSHRADYRDGSTLCLEKKPTGGATFSEKHDALPCPDMAPRLPNFVWGCLPSKKRAKDTTDSEGRPCFVCCSGPRLSTWGSSGVVRGHTYRLCPNLCSMQPSRRRRDTVVRILEGHEASNELIAGRCHLLQQVYRIQ